MLSQGGVRLPDARSRAAEARPDMGTSSLCPRALCPAPAMASCSRASERRIVFLQALHFLDVDINGCLRVYQSEDSQPPTTPHLLGMFFYRSRIICRGNISP